MTHPQRMSRTAKLVEGALMVALAFALSYLPHIELPLGGSITFFHTMPVLVMSLRHGGKWGIGTALVYSLLQTLQGLGTIMICPTIAAMIGCALLDYVLAYTCIGLAGPLARVCGGRVPGLIVGVLATGAGRLLCSFISGIVLWSEYTPEGTPVWLYSLTYNASWAVPDVLAALVALLLLSRIPALALLQPKKGAENAQAA